MKRNPCIFVLLILFSSLFFVACSSGSSQSQNEPVTITFYKRGYTEGGEDITSTTNAKAVEAFEKANPNVKVNIIGVPWTADGDALLKQALDSGENINVFSVNPDDLIRFSREGKVSSIEPYLTDADKADFYASGLNAASVDGTIYAWPIWVTATSIFANTDLFQQRGVALPSMDNPWTWDEFVEAAKQLTFEQDDGAPVYGFNVSTDWWTTGFYPIFYIDGGRILSPDGKRFVQNRPEGLSGLQKLVDLAQVHHVTPPDFGVVSQSEAWDEFKNGQVAMLISTPGFIPQLESEGFPLAVLPPPTGKLGKVVTTGGFGMYGVYNTDDQAKLKASHDFARYITGSQVPQDVPGYQLAPGLRRSNTSYATNPNRKVITELVEFGIYEAPVPISAEVSEKHAQILQAIATGQITPEEGMNEIAPLYQQDLDKAWQ